MDTLAYPVPKFVDKSVDPSRAPAVPFVLPEGAVRDRRNRDHIKGLRFGPVASGASLPATPGFVGPRAIARRIATGIPVSVRPSGERSRGPRPSSPWTRSGGPHARDTPDLRRPIPTDRARRSAGPARRPRGRRPRPIRPGPRGRDRPRLRARRARRRPRGPRSRSRSTTCRAGRPRPRRAMSGGCCSAGSAATPGRDAPGPLPPLRGQRPGAGRPAGPALPAARRPGRRPDERGGRRRSGVRAGDADGHPRPPEPDGPDAAARAERRRHRAAVPGPDRRLGSGAARGAPRRGPGRGRRAGRRRLRRAARTAVRDPVRGPDAADARRRRGRDVDGARVHRRALGGLRGLRRVARHERRGGLHRRAAQPRGGAGRRRRGRTAAREGDPPLRRGAEDHPGT